MSDYIDRNRLKQGIQEDAMTALQGWDSSLMDLVMLDIDEIPAADVEPVRHGRWEGYTHSRYCGIDKHGEPIYRDGTVYYCSNPKCRRKTVIKENFCPSCGAKMVLEEDENA